MSIIHHIYNVSLHLNTRKWQKIYLGCYFHSSTYTFSLRFLWDIFFCSDEVPCHSILYHLSYDVSCNLFIFSNLSGCCSLSNIYLKSFELFISPKHIGPEWLLSEFYHKSVFSNNLILKAHFQLMPSRKYGVLDWLILMFSIVLVSCFAE